MLKHRRRQAWRRGAHRDAETEARFAAGTLREQRRECRELEQRIAAAEALPAPDAAMLAAIRGENG